MGSLQLTVLSGEWRLFNGGPVSVGMEKWRLEETSEVILWNSVIGKSVPFPHREEVNITAIPRKWRITTIKISSAGGDREDSFEGQVKNGNFEVMVKRARSVEHHSIPISESTEFDYLSPVFNTITFHRLRLRRGASREIEAVYIFPISLQNSLQTRMLRQRYKRLGDETISVTTGQFASAKHYVYKNLESGWTGSIWTDNLETVLRYEGLCELLSYTRVD